MLNGVVGEEKTKIDIDDTFLNENSYTIPKIIYLLLTRSLESTALVWITDLYTSYIFKKKKFFLYYSGGEAKDDFWPMVSLGTEILDKKRPRYLMGVGLAIDLVVCVALGVDMFDCVFPTRTAVSYCFVFINYL